MRIVVGLILVIVLFSCESENLIEVKGPLKIYGHAINDDVNTPVPLSNTELKITYYTIEGNTEFDSAITDLNGNFMFERTKNAKEVYQYLIKVQSDYFEAYEPGMDEPWAGFNNKFYVNEELTHYDTVVFNETCNVKFIVEEKTPDDLGVNFVRILSADTFIDGTVEDVIWNPQQTIYSSKEFTYKYFTDVVTSVKYYIDVQYSAGGGIVSSTKVVQLVPSHTEEILVEY